MIPYCGPSMMAKSGSNIYSQSLYDSCNGIIPCCPGFSTSCIYFFTKRKTTEDRLHTILRLNPGAIVKRSINSSFQTRPTLLSITSQTTIIENKMLYELVGIWPNCRSPEQPFATGVTTHTIITMNVQYDYAGTCAKPDDSITHELLACGFWWFQFDTSDPRKSWASLQTLKLSICALA